MPWTHGTAKTRQFYKPKENENQYYTDIYYKYV